MVFTAAYVLAPTFCNAFAAQLEERTLHCYLELLEGVQEGVLLPWGSSFVPGAICRMWGLEVCFLHNLLLAVWQTQPSIRGRAAGRPDITADSSGQHGCVSRRA